MSLPHFAPFPDTNLRKIIELKDWHSYLDACSSLADLYLRLEDQDFANLVSDSDSVPSFLLGFFSEISSDESLLPDATLLRKRCFLLFHRQLSQQNVPTALLSWSILSTVSRLYPKSEQLSTLLRSVWKRKGGVIEKSMQIAKTSLIRNLESKRPEGAEGTLDKLVPLLRTSSDASVFILTGSDFLDAIYSAYPRVPPAIQKKLVAMAYLGLIAVLEAPKPNFSLLSDHLYSLKTSEEQEQKEEPGKKTLVADLVTNTPLLANIQEKTSAPEAARAKNIAASLSIYKQLSIARTKCIVRRKVDNGKSRAKHDGLSHGTFSGEAHVHRMSMISQMQDLFPDLGSGFIMKLLSEYNDNVEEVTAHLLEESLPPHLAEADRNEKLPEPLRSDPTPTHLEPRSSQIPSRRNIFDNDEFDKLTVDASRLHIGRKGGSLTADKILSDRSEAPTKSSILAALAAFDSDDDERDDTYDAEDVGASIDLAAPAADEADADLRDKNEEALFLAYTSTPELFARDADTRRSKARAALKRDTGMTDEAMEGWGIMITRDPKRLRRLEARFSTFAGQQSELASTAWNANLADEGGGEGAGHWSGRGRGFPGRGRGRGRGRGGSTGAPSGPSGVVGPADNRNTQITRQRKEANKGSRANHSRKDQRGKKMARGGLLG